MTALEAGRGYRLMQEEDITEIKITMQSINNITNNAYLEKQVCVIDNYSQ